MIGLILGSILVLVDFLLEPFASAGLSSVILVSLLAFMTRGLHLDGVGDTFDGLGAGGNRDRMLSVMDDSHTGVFGVVAIVLVLFFKIHALESIDLDRWRALLVATILGRWAMVLLAYRSAAAKDGLGSRLINHLQTKHFLIATLLALVLVAAIWRRNGIVMMAWVAVFTVSSKKYFHRRLGGGHRRYLRRCGRIERGLGSGFVGSVSPMNNWKRSLAFCFYAASLLVIGSSRVFAADAASPQRVVSLAPSVTETVFALGFGSRVVGVTTYCDYPAAARRLPKIGGFINPSLEAIVDRKPDLVIGVRDTSHPVKTKEIENLGIRVVLISVTSLDEILNSFESIARLLGKPGSGRKTGAESKQST